MNVELLKQLRTSVVMTGLLAGALSGWSPVNKSKSRATQP